jgi:hypothetical protein
MHQLSLETSNKSSKENSEMPDRILLIVNLILVSKNTWGRSGGTFKQLVDMVVRCKWSAR